MKTTCFLFFLWLHLVVSGLFFRFQRDKAFFVADGGLQRSARRPSDQGVSER